MNLAPVTPDYVQQVALAMRGRDVEEFLAVNPVADQEELALLLRDRYGRRRHLLCACDDAGEPVCIGGAVFGRPGVASLLFFATYAFPKIALPMTRFIKRHYFPSLAAEGIHRIECVSLAGYGDMHRWLETLGMQREGLFRAYGKSREDFVQYAWVA